MNKLAAIGKRDIFLFIAIVNCERLAPNTQGSG